MKRILLIEDDEDARVLFLHQMSRVAEKYQIDVAVTGSQALIKLAKTNYYCVIMDYWLEGSSASELLIEIKSKKLDNPPIIILTSVQDESLGVELVSKGAQDYLIKNEATEKSLVRAIEYAAERHQLKIQLQSSQKQEHYLAYHDPLTSLPNRQAFFGRLDQVVAQVKRDNKKTAVLFLDLDCFKQINDTLGHSAGDELLRNVAEKLNECVRQSDTVARLGGDEFTVVLIDIERAQDVAKVAKKILEKLSMKFNKNGLEYHVTASIGISLFPTDGTEAKELVKNADIAMYRAKKQGKNTYQFYDKSMEAVAFERLALEASLRKAIVNNEFVIHYQPQLSVATGEMLGFEALLRWQHPHLGLLSPDKFLGLAEDSGLILPIGEWVIKTALAEYKQWTLKGFPKVCMTVNLSAKQFSQKKILEKMKEVLKEVSFNPSLLGFEITEESAIEDKEFKNSTLNGLKEMGIKLLIDDFGTGFSSLGYLNQLPIDILKIDHSFLRGIPEDESNSAIVSAVVAMAHQLGLKVVAEGVEKLKEKEFLKKIKCDMYQGYLEGEPERGTTFFPRWHEKLSLIKKNINIFSS